MYFPVVGHAPWRVRKGVSAPAFPIDLGAKGGRVQGRREPRLTDDVSGTRLAARLQALNCVTSPAGAGGRGPRNRLAAVHKAPRRSGPSSRRSPPVTPLFLSRVPAAACPLCSFGPAEHAPAFVAKLPSGVHASVTPLEKSSLTARSKIAAPFLSNPSSRFVHHT